MEISSSDLSVGNKGSFQSFRGDKVKQIPRCKITGRGTLFLFGSSSRTGPPFLPLHSLRTLRIIVALLASLGKRKGSGLRFGHELTTYLQLRFTKFLPSYSVEIRSAGLPFLLPYFFSSLKIRRQLFFIPKYRSQYIYIEQREQVHPSFYSFQMLELRCPSFSEATNQDLSLSRHLSDPKVELIGVVGLVARELGYR